MSTTTVLDPDENGKAVDQRQYKSMIGSLLSYMMTWPDIQFVVCMCALLQASPRSSHQHVVQWIFRYLKYTLEFRIWYSASSSHDLVGFSDASCCSQNSLDSAYYEGLWRDLQECSPHV
jgi:hypothetical protein